MKSEAESIWQIHMNNVYDKWQQNRNTPYETILMRCNQVEFAAVLLGNFNHQVCNGGFEQWIDNGYATQGRQVLRILKDIARHPTTPSNKVEVLEGLYKRVQRLLMYVKPGCSKNSGFGYEYWKHGLEKAGRRYAKRHDNWYYDQDFDEIFECYISEIDRMLYSPPPDAAIEEECTKIPPDLNVDDIRPADRVV